jgi:hypothetical protein
MLTTYTAKYYFFSEILAQLKNPTTHEYLTQCAQVGTLGRTIGMERGADITLVHSETFAQQVRADYRAFLDEEDIEIVSQELDELVLNVVVDRNTYIGFDPV